MPPKLTKREMERERAAAAAAAAAAADISSLDGAAGLLPQSLGAVDVVSYDELGDGSYGIAAMLPLSGGGSGSKRRADEAFGFLGDGGDGSQGDEGDAGSKVSSASKSTAYSGSAGGGKARKTPQRGTSGSGADTPGGTPSLAGAGADKSMKGLRHFSLKVCRKVEEKGLTNYNEVADELVAEVLSPQVDPVTGELQPPECQYDEKNIRRRVYDALNVLMAMEIISKEKKEIRWKGLPSHAQPDLEVLQRDKRRLEQSLQRKREHLQELIMQRVAFQRLVRRNSQREAAAAAGVGAAGAAAACMPGAFDAAAAGGGGGAAPLREEDEARKVPLPFVIINTASATVINCEMTEDRSDVLFRFSAPFEINDDNEVLRRMELHRATPDEVQAYVDPQLLRYVPADVYLAEPKPEPRAAAAACSMPAGLDAAALGEAVVGYDGAL